MNMLCENNGGSKFSAILEDTFLCCYLATTTTTGGKFKGSPEKN